jgi:hypothetical protein
MVHDLVHRGGYSFLRCILCKRPRTEAVMMPWSLLVLALCPHGSRHARYPLEDSFIAEIHGQLAIEAPKNRIRIGAPFSTGISASLLIGHRSEFPSDFRWVQESSLVLYSGSSALPAGSFGLSDAGAAAGGRAYLIGAAFSSARRALAILTASRIRLSLLMSW